MKDIRGQNPDFDSKFTSYTFYLFQGPEHLVQAQYKLFS